MDQLNSHHEILSLGCGHCKNIKPELIQASIDLHAQEVSKKVFFVNISIQFLMLPI